MDTTIYKQAQLTLKKTTWALLQRTEGKDEQNIVYMWKSQRTSQHGTKNVKIHNRKTQTNKNMSSRDPTEQPGMNSGAHEG